MNRTRARLQSDKAAVANRGRAVGERSDDFGAQPGHHPDSYPCVVINIALEEYAEVALTSAYRLEVSLRA